MKKEVRRVRRPPEAERALLGPAREAALQGNEEDGEQQEVEQEPVEPEGGAGVEALRQGDAPSSEEGGDYRQRGPGEPQHLASAQQHADAARHEPRRDHDLDKGPDDRHRVERPEARRAQPLGKPEHEHGEQAQRAEEQAHGAAQPAGAEPPRLVVAEDALEPAIEGRTFLAGKAHPIP
jgi:hypothetical protein